MVLRVLSFRPGHTRRNEIGDARIRDGQQDHDRHRGAPGNPHPSGPVHLGLPFISADHNHGPAVTARRDDYSNALRDGSAAYFRMGEFKNPPAPPGT